MTTHRDLEKVNLLLFGDGLDDEHQTEGHTPLNQRKSVPLNLGHFVRKLRPWIKHPQAFISTVLRSPGNTFPELRDITDGEPQSPPVESLLDILEAMAKQRGFASVSRGCSVCYIENVPRVLAQDCLNIVDTNPLASQFLQCGITCGAGLGLIATDIFGTNISDIVATRSTKQTGRNHFSSGVMIRGIQTDNFYSKQSCKNICQMVSKYVTVLRDRVWNLQGRFMIFGFSAIMNSYATLEEVYTNFLALDETDPVVEAQRSNWVKEVEKLLSADPFFKQLLTTTVSKMGYTVPALHFDATKCKPGASKSFFVTITFNSELDKCVEPVLTRLFRKMRRQFKVVHQAERSTISRPGITQKASIDVYAWPAEVAELEVAVQEEFVFGLEDGAVLADGLADHCIDEIVDHIDRSIRYQLFKDKNVTRVSYTYEANRYVFTLKTYGGGPDTTGLDVAALQKCYSHKFGQIVDFRYEKLVGHYEFVDAVAEIKAGSTIKTSGGTG